mmetsp:Transcript_26018/g.74980  ORF Transcript_26018/g.74980 Transcript_26018/m.74980 type:complete len:222 (+) Transcript_26018:468-1133(+)
MAWSALIRVVLRVKPRHQLRVNGPVHSTGGRPQERVEAGVGGHARPERNRSQVVQAHASRMRRWIGHIRAPPRGDNLPLRPDAELLCVLRIYLAKRPQTLELVDADESAAVGIKLLEDHLRIAAEAHAHLAAFAELCHAQLPVAIDVDRLERRLYIRVLVQQQRGERTDGVGALRRPTIVQVSAPRWRQAAAVAVLPSGGGQRVQVQAVEAKGGDGLAEVR